MFKKFFINKHKFVPSRDEIVRILLYVACVVLRDPPVGLLLRLHFVSIQGCGSDSGIGTVAVSAINQTFLS
jgi:hypothetical protein